MAAQELILVILLGGILGTVGQGIRVIVGLKKLYDESLQKGIAFAEGFKGSTLLFSLLIGFIAGVLGVIGLENFDGLLIGREQVLALIGIGYAGADFIEGFVKKNTARLAAAGDSNTTTAPDGTAAGQ
jgi:hypothetical protein